MNKPSAKTIFFASSMYYSERLVQELKQRLSKNLMRYDFNNWFAVVNDDKFCSTIRFSKSLLFYFFQPDQRLPNRKRIMLRERERDRERSGVWNRWVAYISINLLDNIYNFFLYSGYFLHKNLRELRDMAFCDDILWKLLSDLPAPVLFLLANDCFSVSAIFFQFEIDSFSLEYEVNLDCMIASFPFHHEW